MSTSINPSQQPTQAEKFYEAVSRTPLGCRSEVVGCNFIAKACNQMAKEFEKGIADTTEYMVEIDNLELEAEKIEKENEEKIMQLAAEVDELKAKEKNGEELTETEKCELKNKQRGIDKLYKDTDNKLKNIDGLINNNCDKAGNGDDSKMSTAKDFGNTAIEKGTPLAETKVKGGFFRKLFGTTGKDKKEAGERAVESGKNLLSKVGEHSTASNKVAMKRHVQITDKNIKN